MTPETKTKQPLSLTSTIGEADFTLGWREEVVRTADGKIKIIQILLKALQEKLGNVS